MYQDYFGLRQAPFRITPQTEHFYPGAKRGELLDALLYAIGRDEGIIQISGEVGTGKTMLCRMLIERMPADTHVIYLANPSLNPRELLETIANELEVAGPENQSLLRSVEHRLIDRYAAGKRVVLVVDEAHAMPRESLEQIRLLSNLETATRKLLQIVLFGQPELDEMLAERSMRSLRERITQHFHIAPLTPQQIREYLGFRLQAAGYRGPALFPDHLLPRLARASRGLTRRVNILADKILLAAFADNTRNLDARHVSAAIRDARYENPGLPWGRLGLAVLLLGSLSVAGLYAGTYLRQRGGSHVTTAPPLPAPASTNPAQVTGPQPAPAAVSTSEEPSPPAAPIPPQLGALARERLIASRKDMHNIDGQHWFIQLRSLPATGAASLESFIPSASKTLDPAQLRLFVVKNDPKQTIGVIYGNYTSSRQAQAAVQQLPEWLRASGPFIRQFKSLRVE